MRKILIFILIVLLIILAYFTIFQGISIGNFKILSTKEIISINDNLTMKIDEANTKIKSGLQTKQQELLSNVETLLENKEKYYKVANVSTENEINKANQEEIYDIEYLWLRVGRHARKEGVNMKMDIKQGDAGDSTIKNLTFTVEGKYVGIIDFVSALEDDSELAFRIRDFKLVSVGENLQATFNVTGVRIKIEQTNETIDTTNNVNEEIENSNSSNTSNSL